MTTTQTVIVIVVALALTVVEVTIWRSRRPVMPTPFDEHAETAMALLTPDALPMCDEWVRTEFESLMAFNNVPVIPGRDDV